MPPLFYPTAAAVFFIKFLIFARGACLNMRLVL